jgi:hypothetical protein
MVQLIKHLIASQPRQYKHHIKMENSLKNIKFSMHPKIIQNKTVIKYDK